MTNDQTKDFKDLLKKYSKEHKTKGRSTIVDCCDYLLMTLSN